MNFLANPTEEQERNFQWAKPLRFQGCLLPSMFQNVDFYYSSDMVRATNEETIVTEKLVCYSSQSWGRKHALQHRATPEMPGWVGM